MAGLRCVASHGAIPLQKQIAPWIEPSGAPWRFVEKLTDGHERVMTSQRRWCKHPPA